MNDDFIRRQAVIEFINGCLVREDKLQSVEKETLLAVKGWVEVIPPAAAWPVVQCKYCKKRGWIQEASHGKSVDYCRLLKHEVELDFFCAAGERKDSDG